MIPVTAPISEKETEVPMSLNEEITRFLRERGAVSVGFATLDTLAGGPPSADLAYVLPDARSAISFVLPLDRGKIRDFLGKKDMLAHEKDNIDTNIKSTLLSRELAQLLVDRGFYASGVLSNLGYRQEVDGWQFSMPPDLSHRYVAVRSGAGSFGWSGNVGVKKYGTAVILGTTVTSAELEPTDPISPGDSFCEKCKLCHASCAAGMFDKDRESSVTLGGLEFTFAERINCLLCDLVCGGFTGLHRSGKWSTWSPGRYAIPGEGDEVLKTLARAADNYQGWPQRGDGGYLSPAYPGRKLRLTCGNCQVMCWGDVGDNRENYRLLTGSGCVIQHEGGEIEVLPPERASEEFDKMSPGHRALYC